LSMVKIMGRHKQGIDYAQALIKAGASAWFLTREHLKPFSVMLFLF
jgi:hypothetical protein